MVFKIPTEQLQLLILFGQTNDSAVYPTQGPQSVLFSQKLTDNDHW